MAAKIKSWLSEGGVEPESIAVLTRSQDDRDRYVRGLGERGVTARSVDKKAPAPGQPLLMTMHRAKGMEFSRAILLDGVDNANPVRSAATAGYGVDRVLTAAVAVDLAGSLDTRESAGGMRVLGDTLDDFRSS